jgi:hypothetical protein
VAFFAFCLLLFLVSYFIADIMEKNPRVGFYILAGLFEGFILWRISLEFDPGKALMWSIVVGLTVYVVVFTSVYMDVLIAYRKPKVQKRSSNSLPTTPRWNYLVIIITLGAIVGGYFGFYYMGRSSAKNSDTFYVVKQSVEGRGVSEVIFLGNYGDYLVGVPFHRDTKKFESLVIWKMTQTDNIRLTLTREKVGRLQPVEVKSAEAKP